jgi:two-component system, LuxR family, response regulator FixJ
MSARPRIYVVDDDEQMRRLLSRQLQADYDVMCFAAARHFLDVAPALAAGCLILDMHMPEINGLEVQRCLSQRNLHFPTIMITGRGEVSIAVEAMKAGAVDFVQKPFRRDAILDSIRLAQRHLAPADSGYENSELAKTRLARLSAREVQVLTGLVAGLPNKTIAYDLGLSPRTVEVHRANIMKKMEVPSFSALVRVALAAGIQGRP